jgi:hypothetical protein
MCTGTAFSEYAARAIRQLRELERVKLALLIVDERAVGIEDGADADGISGKLLDVWDKALAVHRLKEGKGIRDTVDQVAWHLYNKVTDRAQCNRKVDLAAELEGVPRIYCEVRKDGYSEYFYEPDLSEIASYDLDFVLRRGFGIIRGEILDVPEYGIWSFHHDDERKYRGSPPCFWEIYEGDPVTGAILQRLTDRLDGGIVLRRGFFPTRRSHNANMNQVKYCSARWPAQVATDILRGHTEYLDGPPTRTDAPVYTKPSPWQVLRYQTKRLRSLGAGLARGSEKWTVGVIDTPLVDLLQSENTERTTWYPELPAGQFIADPFGADLNGDRYIFFEKYSRAVGRGWISYSRLDGKSMTDPEPALDPGFHISYPYLIESDGQLYCTPETKGMGKVRLYRIESPTDFYHEETLLSGVSVSDPTVVEYDGRWWLFCTHAADRWPGHNTDLYVWHAPALRGPWEPHANNPVKTDVRSARPAGTPIVTGEELYRPSQHCAGLYGGKITINRVETLTETAFSESAIGELKPAANDPYSDGRHTVSAVSDVTLIDGKRLVWDRYTVTDKLGQIQNAFLG